MGAENPRSAGPHVVFVLSFLVFSCVLRLASSWCGLYLYSHVICTITYHNIEVGQRIIVAITFDGVYCTLSCLISAIYDMRGDVFRSPGIVAIPHSFLWYEDSIIQIKRPDHDSKLILKKTTCLVQWTFLILQIA